MARILIGNIKGPKGDTGPQGEQGPVGPQGPQGPLPPLVNNALSTEAGVAALDAVMGKTLQDQITQVNSDIQERVVFRQNNKDINVSVNANNDNRVYINALYNSEQFQLIFDFVDHVFRFANNHSGTWDDIRLNESGIQRLAGAIRVFSGNSLDTNITPGVYAVDSSVSNLPISTYGLMIVIKYLNSNWIFNFFIPTDLTRLYINFYNGYGSAGWSGWKHVDFIAS